MQFTSPFDEHEYALAVLRREVPADPELLAAHHWPAVIEALRSEGFDIRDTGDGYALASAGYDLDGTGWSSPEFYPPITVSADLDLDGDTWPPPVPGLAAMHEAARLRAQEREDEDVPVLVASSRDESHLAGELRDVLDRLRGTTDQALDQADAALVRTATALRLRPPDRAFPGWHHHQPEPPVERDLGR